MAGRRLQRLLQSLDRNATVTPARGGTLGACYDADFSSEKRFLKTHLPGASARASLTKEADILAQLYTNTTLLDRFEIPLADGRRGSVSMSAPVPLTAPMQPLMLPRWHMHAVSGRGIAGYD